DLELVRVIGPGDQDDVGIDHGFGNVGIVAVDFGEGAELRAHEGDGLFAGHGSAFLGEDHGSGRADVGFTGHDHFVAGVANHGAGGNRAHAFDVGDGGAARLAEMAGDVNSGVYEPAGRVHDQDKGLRAFGLLDGTFDEHGETVVHHAVDGANDDEPAVG